jgi:hypothetical protein
LGWGERSLDGQLVDEDRTLLYAALYNHRAWLQRIDLADIAKP